MAATGDGAFSCIFLEGEDIYLNCVNDYTRQFISDLYIDMPPVRPADYALDRTVYQAVTFLTRENEGLLLDRAPPPENHPVAPQLSGRDSSLRGQGPGDRRHLGPLRHRSGGGHGLRGTGRTTCPCSAVWEPAWLWAPPAARSRPAPIMSPGDVDEDGVAAALRHFGLV